MREHGRGLDGRTVARGRHRQSVELRLGRRRGRGLRGAQVQARLGRRNGWEDWQADGPNRAKFWLVTIIITTRNNLAKGRIPSCHPRGCEWIRPMLTHVIHDSLDPQESVSKRRTTDRFSRFCTVHLYDQHTQSDINRHTDTQTTLRATCVAIGRISSTACRRCGLMIQDNTYRCRFNA